MPTERGRTATASFDSFIWLLLMAVEPGMSATAWLGRSLCFFYASWTGNFSLTRLFLLCLCPFPCWQVARTGSHDVFADGFSCLSYYLLKWSNKSNQNSPSTTLLISNFTIVTYQLYHCRKQPLDRCHKELFWCCRQYVVNNHKHGFSFPSWWLKLTNRSSYKHIQT